MVSEPGYKNWAVNFMLTVKTYVVVLLKKK